MALQLVTDDIDDILYFARTGEAQEFNETITSICARGCTSLPILFPMIKDPHTGNGPLHMAAANGHADLLRTVIKELSGPSPQNTTQLAILNSQNEAGNTALHWAALNGHLECVKVLLEGGADPTVTNDVGHDAVYEAELNDQKEVVGWVLRESEGLEEGIGGDGAVLEEGKETEVEDKSEDEGQVTVDLATLDIEEKSGR